MPCPVCHDPARAHVISHKGMELFRCASCSTVYMDPMPSYERRAEIYADPYEGATIGYYAKAEKKIKRARRRARMLDRHVREKGAFLDIGCSGGFTTEAMRELGYKCDGLDPDAPGIAYAKKNFPQNTYFHGFLEDVAPKLGTYDAIHCSEVIEHIPDPRGFTRTLAKLLKLGGVANVTTPDITHWRRPRDLTKWDAFTPPAHCLFFTPYSLRILFAAHGLEIFKQRFDWKPGIQVYARKTYAA